MHSHRHDPKPLTRLVHLLLLLGWLLSSHGIAPAVCMMAAVLDGDHAVKVGLATGGARTVVLSHAGKSSAELKSHEHDVLCRMLMAFASVPEAGAADHVLAFKPVDDASRTQRLGAMTQKPAPSASPLLVISFYPVERRFGRAGEGPALRGPRTWSQGLALKPGRTVMRC